MYIWSTLAFFALIPSVLSSHFRGGLLTWKAVNETQILVRHLFSYVYSYCSNPQTNTLDCIDGCTGSVILNANCTESNSAENWANFEGETIFDTRNSTPSPLSLRFASGDWISLVWPTPATSWSLKMSVDLSQRNDIGSINHSPVSSMALNIIYPCLINQYVHIPVADFDGDNVRCRFASGSDECASICSDHTSFLTLNESNTIPCYVTSYIYNISHLTTCGGRV